MNALTALVASAAVALTASTAAAQSDLEGSISIAGSSTVGPLTNKVIEEFEKQYEDVNISNAITGTGGGFKRFVAGETDISNASRPIKFSEIEAALENGIEFIEIAVAYDGLSICVNKDNDWVDELSIEQLEQLFTDGSTVRTWRDLDPSWPAVEVKMFIPGTDSGTFDYFKEVVLGKKGQVRSTQLTVSEDDNILVEGIESDRGGIGFFGCSYYFENQDVIRAVPIKPSAEEAGVYPTPDTIASNEYKPFARPLFIYVNKESATKPHVRAFVQFYLSNSPQLSEEVGYVRLGREIAYRSSLRFTQHTTGSVYWDLETGEKHEAPLVDLLSGRHSN